jgi:hypothetical protein
MAVFHQVNVAYDRQTGEDNPGKVKETYLVEAVSCADAEQQVLEHVQPLMWGNDCDIPQVRKRLFFDVFPSEDKTLWFEAKVELITIDGDRETRKAVKFLIQEDSIHQALKELKFKLSAIDCDIISIAQSPIIEVMRNEIVSCE